MTLPEIPDEAVAAAEQAFIDAGPIYGTTAEPIVRAAWPHLYAAALRHAADRAAPGGIDHGKQILASVWLRRLADEASPSLPVRPDTKEKP